MTELSPLFKKVELRFGFMETPNVPKGLAIARKQGWHFDIMSTSFFLSRRLLKPAAKSGMPRWQDNLFIRLSKSASDATDFFQIPTGRGFRHAGAADGAFTSFRLSAAGDCDDRATGQRRADSKPLVRAGAGQR
jgi:K+ transporter